jgi:integration host factor subunit beta
VTKKEIVRRISDRAELTQLKTKEIVQWTFDAIIDTLITDGRIELRNFGVFEVRRRKARRARNPRTNDRVDVPEKNVVTFQPGKEMEERVRREAKVYEPKRKKPKGPAAANTNTAKVKPAPAANKAKGVPKGKAKSAPAAEAGSQPAAVPPEQELVVVGAPADNPVPAEASA